MQRINVLSIQSISAEDRAKIEAVDPAIELTDAGGWYDGEIRETWPAFTTTRYLAPGAAGSGTREERDVVPGRHFPACHGELGVFGLAATDHCADLQVVRNIKKSHVGSAARHELGNVIGAPRVTTHQLMIS